MSHILVLVADPRLGERLRAALAGVPGFEVAGVVSSLAQGRLLLDGGNVDVVVTDLWLPDAATPRLMAELTALRGGRRPRVVAVAITPEDPRLYQAVCHGADDLLAPVRSATALAGAIRQALSGEAALPAPLARRIAAEFAFADLPEETIWDLQNPLHFSRTEQEIVRLAAQERLPFEIGDALGLSPAAVGRAVRGIYQKLHLGRRAEGLALAA